MDSSSDPRLLGNEILNKKCKPVKEMTDRTKN